MKLVILVLIINLFSHYTIGCDIDPPVGKCDETNCKLPNCVCPNSTPEGIDSNDIPQV